MKSIASIAAAAALLAAGLAFAAEPPPAKPVVLKGEKQGEVTFKHETHKAQACTVCHADDKGGKIDKLKEQKPAHALCQDCHKKDPEKKAPTKCTECHKKK